MRPTNDSRDGTQGGWKLGRQDCPDALQVWNFGLVEKRRVAGVWKRRGSQCRARAKRPPNELSKGGVAGSEPQAVHGENRVARVEARRAVKPENGGIGGHNGPRQSTARVSPKMRSYAGWRECGCEIARG